MLNFLLADDNAIVRSVLKFLIEERYSECRVHESDTAGSLIALIKKTNYDLVMIDINISDKRAVDLINTLVDIRPGLKVLMFGLTNDRALAKRYLDLGVMGCLAIDEQEDEIKKSLETVLNNAKYISPKLFYRQTA